MDRLAAEGVRFNRAHVTAASCSPSRGSIMTGLYPHQHGMFSLSQQGWAKMHEDVPKLPNAMKALGYRTAIIGKTHYEPEELFQWDYRNVDGQKVVMERDVRWMNAQAREWLSKDSEKPFLLCMSYVDPHRGGGRYEPSSNEIFPRIRQGLPENPVPPEETIPVPFLGVDSAKVRMENSDYYACVQRLDTGVGELLEMMKAQGVLDNTLIVLIGDHGPDLTRGKISAYATATHIPMLIRWPGRAQAGLVREELVSTIDLFPTFVTAGGGSISDERQTGRALQPLLEPGKPEWRQWLGTEFISHVPWHYYPRYTILTGQYQLIHNMASSERENPLEPHNYCYAWQEVQNPEYADTQIRTVYDHVERPPEWELFDVEADPYLFRNLASLPEHQEEVKKLAEQISEWRRQTNDPFLDPAFAAAYEKSVQELEQAWIGKSSAGKPRKNKKASAAVKLPGTPIPDRTANAFQEAFNANISSAWASPTGTPGQAASEGILASPGTTGLCMTREFHDSGINAGRIEASAIFVQTPEAVPHNINWNVGFSSANTRYIQNMDADTVCARFVTAGPNKGRIRWAIYDDASLVGQTWSGSGMSDWKPGDHIRLTVAYDLDSGNATARAENLTTGELLAEDSVVQPGISGLRYTGFEMTMLPEDISDAAGYVKNFEFRAFDSAQQAIEPPAGAGE